MYNENMEPVKFKVPHYHLSRLKEISKDRQISMYRLIAFAIDNELVKDYPFEFDTILPELDSLEFTYADQGGKILDFIKTLRKGAGLDILLLLRFKIGVPNKQEFLSAFTELLSNEMIEAFVPSKSVYSANNPDNYYYYRAKGPPTTPKKTRNKASRYKQFLRLQREFKHE